MPRAEIASKQAAYTLGLLHAELAGKLLTNKREAIRLRTAMLQVEGGNEDAQSCRQHPAHCPETARPRQPVVQARDVVSERHRRAAACRETHDGPGHCGCLDRRE